MAAEYFLYGDSEVDGLSQRDPRLGEAIARIGRVNRRVTPDPFTALVESVVSQQVSSAAADTVIARLRSSMPMTPETFATADPSLIAGCGISARKVSYIKGVADAVTRGELDLTALAHADDSTVAAMLLPLRGVGRWTVEMMLIFCLQRPDVVSWDDLAIRRGMSLLYDEPALTRETFDERRRVYSPHGSVASLYLWEISAGR